MMHLLRAATLASWLALPACSLLVDFDRSRIPDADAGDAETEDAGDDAG